VFPIWNNLKQGDASMPLLFKFAVEYTIKKILKKKKTKGLEINGTSESGLC
jgi:hypothetical protein